MSLATTASPDVDRLLSGTGGLVLQTCRTERWRPASPPRERPSSARSATPHPSLSRSLSRSLSLSLSLLLSFSLSPSLALLVATTRRQYTPMRDRRLAFLACLGGLFAIMPGQARLARGRLAMNLTLCLSVPQTPCDFAYLRPAYCVHCTARVPHSST